MRRVLTVVSWIGVGCLGAIGCTETPKRPVIRPPKEEFHVPPPGKFAGPVEYPKGLLNNVTPRRPSDDDIAPPIAGSGANGPSMMGRPQ